MKKLLMIAYDFPPLGGAASIRATKLAKYLPEFGWTPVIETVRQGRAYHGFEDASLLDELPDDLRVFRTRCPEPDSIWNYFRKTGQAQVGATATGEHEAAGNLRKWGIALDRLIRKLLIPDPRVGWLPFGLGAGLVVIRNQGIDAIMTSSPPETSHLIGLWLKKLTGKPWVAEFRDAWTDNPFAEKSLLRRSIEHTMERKTVRAADHITTASEPIAQMLKNKHGLPKRKMTVIPIGFDRADFVEQPDKKRSSPRFIITYLGTLGPGRSPNFFLAALHLLVSENPEVKDNVTVRFIGNLPPETTELAKKLALDGMIENINFLHHRQSLRLLADSDLLLLLLDDLPKGDAVYTGKIFEYLAARRPILALAPEGVAADLVRASRTGVVVPPGQIRQIKDELRKLYYAMKSGSFDYSPDEETVNRFDRRALVGRMAEILDGVVRA